MVQRHNYRSRLIRMKAFANQNKSDSKHKFLTHETEFVLFLAVLENSVLPMG